MGFSRQEYWSGLPFPSPGDLLDLGIEPASLKSPALAEGFFTTSATWEALSCALMASKSHLLHCHLHLCCCCCCWCPTLPPYKLQRARLLCPSLSLGVCSNSCPLSQWCHPTISSSVAPFPPALNLSQHQGLFQWVNSLLQSIGASASASVLPVNIQGWFLMGLMDKISLLSKGLSRVFSSNTMWKHQFFGVQPSLWSSSNISTWLLEKP